MSIKFYLRINVYIGCLHFIMYPTKHACQCKNISEKDPFLITIVISKLRVFSTNRSHLGAFCFARRCILLDFIIFALPRDVMGPRDVLWSPFRCHVHFGLGYYSDNFGDDI